MPVMRRASMREPSLPPTPEEPEFPSIDFGQRSEDHERQLTSPDHYKFQQQSYPLTFSTGLIGIGLGMEDMEMLIDKVEPGTSSSSGGSSTPDSPHSAASFLWPKQGKSSHLLEPVYSLGFFSRRANRRLSARHISMGIRRSLRSRKYVALVVIIVILMIGTRPNQESIRTAARQIQNHRCKVMPWASSCSRNPYEGLQYDIAGGLLYYPARPIIPITANTSDITLAEGTKDYPLEQWISPQRQPHPIHQLIKEAEANWAAKLNRQSKTLEHAVEEYYRRYDRAPPKGFDKWYAFAKKHNVQMIDEYDMINERILPFASLPPDVLKSRSEMLQHDKDFWMHPMTFTVKVRNEGKDVIAEGPMRSINHRPDQMLALLQGITEYMPDVNLTMTGHDSPWIVVSGEARARHIAAAKNKQFIDPKDYENFGENGALEGWALICPPDSQLRKEKYFDERKEWKRPPVDSFIRDHVPAMDICNHPEDQAIHGFTSWPGPRPALLFPVFSFTVSHLHSDLLLPALEQWERPVGPDPVWKDKKHNKVIWRGSTTGSDLTQTQMRKWSQRPRLCRIPGQTGVVTLDMAYDDREGRPGPTTSYTEHASDLADEYFDFKFQGRPLQCGDAESCAKFGKDFDWDTFMTEGEQNEYKYVIDIDGNGWSGRFHRLMASNTLVLKSTIFPEWWSDRIQPWVHYVPIKTDYTDLWSAMAFFKGDLEGRGSHDALAEKIASQGKEWANTYWRWEDMQAYLLRLVLEYARVISMDPSNPSNMDYKSPLDFKLRGDVL